MSANFDSTSAELQPEKEKQTEQRKKKSWAECSLMDHQRSIQTKDSDWTHRVNSKRKNTQRPLMEDSHIGN